MPELAAGTREVPNPVRDDELERGGRKWQLVHRCTQQTDTIRETSVRHARGSCGEHRQREVGTDRLPARVGQRQQVPAGAAPDVE